MSKSTTTYYTIILYPWTKKTEFLLLLLLQDETICKCPPQRSEKKKKKITHPNSWEWFLLLKKPKTEKRHQNYSLKTIIRMKIENYSLWNRYISAISAISFHRLQQLLIIQSLPICLILIIIRSSNSYIYQHVVIGQ